MSMQKQHIENMNMRVMAGRDFLIQKMTSYKARLDGAMAAMEKEDADRYYDKYWEYADAVKTFDKMTEEENKMLAQNNEDNIKYNKKEKTKEEKKKERREKDKEHDKFMCQLNKITKRKYSKIIESLQYYEEETKEERKNPTGIIFSTTKGPSYPEDNYDPNNPCIMLYSGQKSGRKDEHIKKGVHIWHRADKNHNYFSRIGTIRERHTIRERNGNRPALYLLFFSANQREEVIYRNYTDDDYVHQNVLRRYDIDMGGGQPQGIYEL